MCVSSEEGHEGTSLIPSDEHFRTRVAEKAANIGCATIRSVTCGDATHQRGLTAAERHAADVE